MAQVPALTVVGGAVLAGGAAIGPDMDTQGTAARSLGLLGRIPAKVLNAVLGHRGPTHWLVTAVAVAAAAYWVLAYQADRVWPVLLLLAVPIAWWEAGVTAGRSRRLGAPLRIALATVAALALAWYAPTLTWVVAALGLGWALHLVGDCLTERPWPLLAPLTWRRFGGWGWTSTGGGPFRVSRRERLIEAALVALGLTCLGVTLWPGDVPVVYLT